MCHPIYYGMQMSVATSNGAEGTQRPERRVNRPVAICSPGHVHEALGGALPHRFAGHDGLGDEVRLVIPHLCRQSANADGLGYRVGRPLQPANAHSGRNGTDMGPWRLEMAVKKWGTHAAHMRRNLTWPLWCVGVSGCVDINALAGHIVHYACVAVSWPLSGGQQQSALGCTAAEYSLHVRAVDGETTRCAATALPKVPIISPFFALLCCI